MCCDCMMLAVQLGWCALDTVSILATDIISVDTTTGMDIEIGSTC